MGPDPLCELDQMADEELTEFIEAQGEVVRELQRQLLPPPASKQRKGAAKHLRIPQGCPQALRRCVGWRNV